MSTVNSVKTGMAATPKLAPAPTTLESLLKSTNIKAKFEEMLGKKASGFISSIISVANMSKALKECDPKTVIASAAVAASLDLPINPSLGFAHIVPYSGRAQLQMGWRGFVQLGIRSGQYEDMNVSEVYEDELEQWNPITGELRFSDPKLWKLREECKTEKIVGFAASFRLLNGFRKSLYMTKSQVLAHGKRYSQSFSSDSGQWKKNPDAMCKKTLIKMLLSRWGIMSIEMQKAQRYDQAIIKDIDGKEIEYADSTALLEMEDAPKESPLIKTIELAWEGFIKKVKIENIENGKPQFSILAKDGVIFHTFSESLSQEASKFEKDGKKVRCTYEQSLDGNEIFTVTEAK